MAALVGSLLVGKQGGAIYAQFERHSFFVSGNDPAFNPASMGLGKEAMIPVGGQRLRCDAFNLIVVDELLFLYEAVEL